MNFWGKTKRFLGPALENKWRYIFLAGISVIFGSSTGYLMIYINKVFTELFGTGKIDGFKGEIINAIIIFLIISFIGFLLRDYSWVYPQIEMKKNLETKYFGKYIKIDNQQVEKIGTGRMLSILSGGLDKWSLLLNESLNNVFRWIAFSSISIILISNLNYYYGLAFIALFLCVCSTSVYFSNWGLIWRKKRKEIYVELARQEAKIVMSKFEILQNSKIQNEINVAHLLEDEILNLSKKTVLANVATWQISRFIILLFTLSICIFLYFKLKTHPGDISVIVDSGVLLGLMSTFTSNFNLLIDYYIGFTKEFVHIEKLWSVFDDFKPIKNYSVGEKFVFKQGDFDIKNLGFSYNNSTEVLSHFSLSIQGGKRTALVGRSGSGKTTLMKLLAGYMAPTSGELLIDGQDISSIRLDSYYPHIGYLTQEPSVFDGTIEENLLFGTRKKPTKKDIEQAIKGAECEFIYELEKGLKTEIGERGVRLSGGQKQRLAIAKIFLKNPEIILLDEPTAALDSYSEEKVARAFEHLFEGRTVIVIAHRLQTVKSADDIIVLEKGKIAERGTHKQLLKLGGKYAGMVDLQSGVVKEEDNEEVYEK